MLYNLYNTPKVIQTSGPGGRNISLAWATEHRQRQLCQKRDEFVVALLHFSPPPFGGSALGGLRLKMYMDEGCTLYMLITNIYKYTCTYTHCNIFLHIWIYSLYSRFGFRVPFHWATPWSLPEVLQQSMTSVPARWRSEAATERDSFGFAGRGSRVQWTPWWDPKA